MKSGNGKILSSIVSRLTFLKFHLAIGITFNKLLQVQMIWKLLLKKWFIYKINKDFINN